MKMFRVGHTTMLGHRIEKIEKQDRPGVLERCSFEVRCPQTNAVLGTFANQEEAQWFVLARELKGVSAAFENPKRVTQ